MLIDTKLIRRKILDLAIRGKLVPQDPADESASELLQRIHAEKSWRIRKIFARTHIKLKKRRKPPLNGSTKTRILVYVVFDYFPPPR